MTYQQQRLLALSIAVAAVVPAETQATIAHYQEAIRAEPDLVSYYTFDGGNANDSAASNHGEIQGIAIFEPGVGMGADRALVLRGAGHVNLGQVSEFDFESGAGTIEAWVRADWGTSPGYNPTIFADRSGGPVNWSIHMQWGKEATGLWNGSSYQPIGTGAAGATWHHMAAVFDYDPDLGVGRFTLYWDGERVGSTQQAIGASPSATTQLGSSSASGQEQWIGALDEVAFYSAALDAAVIKEHYLALLVGEAPTIQEQPRGGTFLEGVPLVLAVEVKGVGLSYQWYKNDVPIGGGTQATLNLGPLAPAGAGIYHVVVRNSAGQAVSDKVEVRLGNLPTRLKQYQDEVRAEPSLISYFTFDVLNAKDSKASNDGQPQERARFDDGVDGAAGKALVLDGSGHVNLGEVPDFNFYSGAGTIEAWVRADWTADPAYNPTIFADRDGGPVNWSIHMNRGKEAAGLWNGSNYLPVPISGTGTAWHHLAAVFDFDADLATYIFTLYWDGALVGTTPQGIGSAPDAPTQFGSASPVGQERWIGALDEVAFYSEALGADRIAAHYAAFMSGNAPTITVHPAGGSYLVGSRLVLSVGAQGADLTYQWFKGESPISSATGPELVFEVLDPLDAGAYRVRVSNPFGSIESEPAEVRVIVPNLAAYRTNVRSEPSLISYYAFDSGNADDSKSGNHGTIADEVAFDTGVGLGLDLALVLAGSGHVNLGQVNVFDFDDGTGTVEAWVRADWTSWPGYNPAIFADRDGGPVSWSIHMNSGKEAAGLWNGSTYQPVPIVSAGTGWHHLAVVFNQDAGLSTFSLYWDGELASSTLQPIGTGRTSPTQLGSSSVIGQERWIGALDEVAFYSDPLGPETIRTHYQTLMGTPVVSPMLLVTLTGKTVALSWPADAIGFRLESVDSLPGGSWTPVAGVSGNSATLPASDKAVFYRLARP